MDTYKVYVFQNRIFVCTIGTNSLLKQPRTLAMINKRPEQAVIDSGATVSIVHENVLPKNCNINRTGFTGILRDISTNLKVLGTAKLNFQISKNVVIHHEFLVLSKIHSLPTNVLVGTDLLSKMQAVIDFKDKLLKGQYKGTNFTTNLFSGSTMARDTPDASDKVYSIHAKNASSKLIAPNSELFYKAFTKAPDGEYGINKSTLKPGCFIAESLVEVHNNTVYLRIINITGKGIFLPENCFLSSLYNICDESIFNINVTTENRNKITISDVPSLKDKLGGDKVIDILNKYRDTVSIEGENLGCTNLLEAEIPTGNSAPIFTKEFPLPHKQREIIKGLCDDMLEKNIIKKSVSPWNSPMFLVKKPNGEFRPVVDFRKINSVTVTDPFPLPRVNSILQSLHGSSIYSTLDLNNGFFQVSLAKQDREKTAFTTDIGRYEFQKCPFGIKNAPNMFSRLMNIAMADLLGSHCFLYMDDLIVHSADVESHLAKLEKILNRLAEVNLTIKLKKCNFLQTKLKYLGNEVSKHGISVHSDHFLPIQAYKTPINRKQIQQFLGLISYFRSFVPNFASICEPITKLLKKNIKFAWTKEAQAAFERIKLEIMSSGKLIYPDFSEPFIIQTDASGFSIGGALCQVRNGIMCPIFFVSRCLSKTEQNYSTTKRELLAIMFSLKKFRSLILGYNTTVYCDHKPLVGIFKTSSPEGTMGRWVLEAQEYNIDVKYLPGKLNILGDSLSRIKVNTNVEDDLDDFKIKDYIATIAVKPKFSWSVNQLKSAQAADVKLSNIIKCLLGKEKITKNIVDIDDYVIMDNVLYKRFFTVRCGVEHTKMCICVPDSMAQTVINNVHRSLGSGHRGFQKTLEKVKNNFYINRVYSEVKRTINSCDECKRFKGLAHQKAQLQKYPLPTKPWERVSMDFLGPLRATSNNNRYILGFTDYLTRYLVLYPLPDRSSITVASTLKKFIATYDVPKVLISDNAREFVGQTLKAVCESAGINKCEVLSYSPHSNGLIERKNADISKILKVFCGSDYYFNTNADAVTEGEWDLFLPEVQAAINSSVNRSLGDTPHFALFHFDRRDIYTGDRQISEEPIYNYDNYFSTCETRRRTIYENIKKQLSESIEKYTNEKNKNRKVRDLSINQRVFIKRVPKPGEFKKFAAKWNGPGYIVGKQGPNKYKVHMTHNNKVYEVHVDNILTRHSIIDTSIKNGTAEAAVPCTNKRKSPTVGIHKMITRSKKVQ